MNQSSRIADGIGPVVDSIVADIERQDKAIDSLDVQRQPDYNVIVKMIHNLFRIVYPGYYLDHVYKALNVRTTIATLTEDVGYHLSAQIARALRFDGAYQNLPDSVVEDRAENITVDFLAQIPCIRDYLDTDVQALFDGDPAATSTDEIIIAYPGLYAISVYRFAHELYVRGVPIIPRIMTEHAHSETGIDINPGATIGKYFFIDHGTGVVVGETTDIGEHVKLYQGVTLGALSTSAGQGLRKVRRHPTIEDRVTVYSNASVLGGETVIGHDSVIGGSVFLTRSVPPNTKVYAKSQELHFNTKSNSGKKPKPVDTDQAWFYVI